MVWGQHSAVHAAKALLLAALGDATNQRFQMVGEQAVPLFPPSAVYVAIMREARSTVSACQTDTQVRGRKGHRSPMPHRSSDDTQLQHDLLLGWGSSLWLCSFVTLSRCAQTL